MEILSYEKTFEGFRVIDEMDEGKEVASITGTGEDGVWLVQVSGPIPENHRRMIREYCRWESKERRRRKRSGGGRLLGMPGRRR